MRRGLENPNVKGAPIGVSSSFLSCGHGDWVDTGSTKGKANSRDTTEVQLCGA
jgi:hypothetical protein